MPAEAGIDESDEIPARLVTQAKEIGLYGYALPAEYGGLGLSVEQQVRLTIELGYTCPAFRSLFGTNNGIAGQALVLAGTATYGCSGSTKAPARSSNSSSPGKCSGSAHILIQGFCAGAPERAEIPPMPALDFAERALPGASLILDLHIGQARRTFGSVGRHQRRLADVTDGGPHRPTAFLPSGRRQALCD